MTMHRTAVYVQEACYEHRYIRTRDDSAIVERPERLRSVAWGLAAAIARIEETALATELDNATIKSKESGMVAAVPTEHSRLPNQDITKNPGVDADSELSSALDRLTIDSGPGKGGKELEVKLRTNRVQIVKCTARTSLLNDPAVKFIHGDIDG
jgi:histone deacetylase HOS3